MVSRNGLWTGRASGEGLAGSALWLPAYREKGLPFQIDQFL